MDRSTAGSTTTGTAGRSASGTAGRTTSGTAAPTPRRGVLAGVAVAALLAGGVVGGVLVAGLGGDDEAASPEPGSIEAVAAELAEGQAAESAALTDELAEAAVTAHDGAEDVLAGLAVVSPPEGAVPADQPAEPDPQAMAGEVEAARDLLAATAQGADDHGVTRAALIGALDLMGVAVETAGALPAEGDATADREEVLARVARDRDAAVELWQAGATRLDSLVVSNGGEHIHLFLAPDGNPESVPLEFQELHED